MSTLTSAVYELAKKTGAHFDLCKMALEHAQNNKFVAQQMIQRWSMIDQKNNTIYSIIHTFVEGTSAVIVKLTSDNQSFIKSDACKNFIIKMAEECVRYDMPVLGEQTISNIKRDENISIEYDKIIVEKQNKLSLLTTYTHNQYIGTIIEAIVENEEAYNNILFKKLCFNLAMHVAVHPNYGIDKIDVSDDFKNKFYNQCEKELSAQNKSMAIWKDLISEKFIKWSNENILLNQNLISKNEKISKIISDIENNIGSKIIINKTCRMSVK